MEHPIMPSNKEEPEITLEKHSNGLEEGWQRFLNEAKETSYYYTAKASDLVRQLGLAGVGVIWIFKNTAIGKSILPRDLVIPLFSILLGLAFDLGHYLYAGFVWDRFFRRNEHKPPPASAEKIGVPESSNKMTYFFYYSKVALIIFGYIFLLKFLLGKILF